MRRFAIVCLSAFLLTGCADAFYAVAKANNAMDVCQHANPPNYCGASTAVATIRNSNGQVIGKIYK